jgi:hypothetical protein
MKKLTAEEIIEHLCLELRDIGLRVTIYDGNSHIGQYYGKFVIEICDIDSVVCNYPKDEMDWLYNKPIMMDFYKDLSTVGIERDIDYKLYGGGNTAHIVFDNKEIIKL